MLVLFYVDIDREHISTWDCEKRYTAVSGVLVCTVEFEPCKEQVLNSHAAIQTASVRVSQNNSDCILRYNPIDCR